MQTYKNRSEVPTYEKWDLTHIFTSVAEWEKSYQAIEKLIEELKQYNENINDGAALLTFLKKQEELSNIFTLVYAYAKLGNDLDTRDHDTQVLLKKAESLSYKLREATAFFLPFLLSMDEAVLKTYIEENEGLRYFEKDLFETFRYKQYVLNKEKEELLSLMGEAYSVPSNVYKMINNADIQFGDVTNDRGEKVELTRGMYHKLLKDPNRDKRKEAYKAYYKPYVQMKNSIATTLAANIKNNVTMTKIRNYPSALEKSLFGDMVPKEVYDNLIATTKQNIAALHKYSEIRKEKLALDELRQYDLSMELVDEVEQTIPYEEAYNIMLQALKPLGEDYIQTLSSFRNKNYIDVRETPGKMSGAYNMGVYGVHPYVLLNHQDNVDSLFTLVHEMGHAMHSYYSSKYQPRISAGYSIFVAEVASTVNEVLLIHHLLKEATDPAIKKYYINHFIEMFRGTFFTQVMFAEFEKTTHELAEKGEPLNVEVFNNIYERLFKEYNGSIITFDDEVKYGWSRIPHFYRPFYVYKYATGFATAIHLADQLVKGNKEAQQKYIAFLQSGSSDYPLELLKNAGVDLNSPEPIESALQYFTNLVNEFQTL
ncbi:oligoendopeptidase F [Bacillus massiliigorillae]|uniref:oligoendopeptidase F n=1 Tax=Bacillus massiliigorillae TaxID=1243664 RepID=UPI0003A5A485|nr:oligoendopeptidase F [Bacillus massiliigorillae]